MQRINTQFISGLKGRINEQVLLIPFLWVVLLYIAFYGKYVTNGFSIVYPTSAILYIFIPIVIVDVLKIVLECSAPFSFGKTANKSEDLHKVSVIIPTKDGAETLAATLSDLLKRFKPSQIIISSNGSTDRTVAIGKAFQVNVLDIEKAVGKIDAINAALHLVKTEYCLTMDDDVLIGNARIPTELLTNATGVAFRVLPLVHNAVTALQSHEYRKSMDIGKNFHNESATVQNISGAIGLFRTQELRRQVSLHTGEFSGEDLQRTLLIHLAESDNRVVLSESLVYTEVPDTFFALYRQRVFGWNPGFLSNVSNFFKILLKKDTHPRLRYEAFYTLFLVLVMDPLRLIALPILIWSPVISIMVYFTYVILEFIPYIKLGRKEPLWVPFVIPFYGIAMFLARMTGALVFTYRRAAVFLARKPRLDDYRTVSARYRLASLMVASSVFIMTLGYVAYVEKSDRAVFMEHDFSLFLFK